MSLVPSIYYSISPVHCLETQTFSKFLFLYNFFYNILSRKAYNLELNIIHDILQYCTTTVQCTLRSIYFLFLLPWFFEKYCFTVCLFKFGFLGAEIHKLLNSNFLSNHCCNICSKKGLCLCFLWDTKTELILLVSIIFHIIYIQDKIYFSYSSEATQDNSEMPSPSPTERTCQDQLPSYQPQTVFQVSLCTHLYHCVLLYGVQVYITLSSHCYCEELLLCI